MANRPPSVSVALILTLINALLWLVFGVIIAVDLHPALPDDPFIKGTMAILSLAASGTLLGLYLALRKTSRIAFFLTLGVFISISLLTFADQFGLADLVVLALNLVPVFLLIKDRAWYLQDQSRERSAV